MTRIALDIYAEDDDANARTIEISLEADVGYGVLLDAARAACAVIDADGVTTGPDAALTDADRDPGVMPTPPRHASCGGLVDALAPSGCPDPTAHINLGPRRGGLGPATLPPGVTLSAEPSGRITRTTT
jgi:hypothetical protein